MAESIGTADGWVGPKVLRITAVMVYKRRIGFKKDGFSIWLYAVLKVYTRKRSSKWWSLFCCQSFYYLLIMYRRTTSLFCRGYRAIGQLLSWTRGDYSSSAVKCSRGKSFGELGHAKHGNSPTNLQKPVIQKKNGQLMPARKGDFPIANRKASREEGIG